MKKRTSFALIFVLLFSLLCTTSCNLFQPQIQSTTPESTSTEAPSDTMTPETTTPEATTKEELTNVPPATLASYEEVISLYRIAVERLKTYCKEDPKSSIYTEEIANADDSTKALYESIFLSAYAWYGEYSGKYNNHGTEAYGYTIFDINGDKTHELILMTDEYDIIAVFTIFCENATLLLDNRKKLWYHFDGSSINHRYKGQSATGTEKYYDDNYFIKDGKITKHSTELADYPSIQYREHINAYSKQNITSPFVRLSGALTIQKPHIYNWTWSNSHVWQQFPFLLDIGAGIFTQEKFDFWIMSSSYKLVTDKVSATRKGEVAYFDSPEISGRIEFGYQSVWLIIEKSAIESIACDAYLLTDLEYSKG